VWFSTFSTFFIVENLGFIKNFQTLLTFGKSAVLHRIQTPEKNSSDKNKKTFSSKRFVENTTTQKERRKKRKKR